MTDLNPKKPTVPPTEPGTATALNPLTKVTVWYDELKDRFTFSPDPNGDMKVTRYKGEKEEYPLHFEQGPNQDWKFVEWTWAGIGTAPVVTGVGKPVLELDDLQDELIEVTDRIDIPDKTSYRYKYSFAIELVDGTRKEKDPEIQNNREATINRP